MTHSHTINSEHKIEWMKMRPIAHRGLHDKKRRIYENTLSAALSAVENNYNIEVDLQLSSNGIPMVFHDETLDRLTDENGSIRDRSAEELQKINIMDSQDTIPTLQQLLDLVMGKSAIVLELKGHETDASRDNGFVKAIIEVLNGYKGDVAIMSFDHHLVRDARNLDCPHPVGLTAYKDDEAYQQHTEIAQECNVDFISYELENLDTRFVKEFKQTGRPVISWTVKSAEDHTYSNKFADQPTFEGFKP